MINFKQNLYREEHNFKEEIKALGPKGEILGSDKISGIEVRLTHVIVKDNHTPKIFPFPGLAKIYFINLVASDIANQAISLDIKGFEKVDDGDALAIDKTLFYWKKEGDAKSPSQIHIMSSIIKSKQDLRNVGDILNKINQDNDYKDLTDKLMVLLGNASKMTNISNVILSLSSIVGKYLGKVEDKPLLTWFQSFTDIDGDWDTTGKTIKHAENKYAAMDLSITIRDKERQLESEKK